MTQNEIELIKMIRNNANPEQAILTATVIMIAFLKQPESSAAQVPVCQAVSV